MASLLSADSDESLLLVHEKILAKSVLYVLITP